MCKALIGSIGLFIVAVLAIVNEMSLVGILSRLWVVIACAYVLGGILDIAFSSVFKEAIDNVFNTQSPQQGEQA